MLLRARMQLAGEFFLTVRFRIQDVALLQQLQLVQQEHLLEHH